MRENSARNQSGTKSSQVPTNKQTIQQITPWNHDAGVRKNPHTLIDVRGSRSRSGDHRHVHDVRVRGADLNLWAVQLYPAGSYFEAGNKGTLSFSWVDESRLWFAAEDRIRPFFETLHYWGIQRRRTRVSCDACGRLLGHVYDDGPPLMEGTGQFGMGPSQVVLCRSRYRIKIKAVVTAASGNGGAAGSASVAAVR